MNNPKNNAAAVAETAYVPTEADLVEMALEMARADLERALENYNNFHTHN